ncbi:Putative tetratricopeptide repeat protein 41 [Vulpes lagopus]
MKKTNLNPLKLTILANELRECRIYRNEYQCLKENLEVVSIQELWELILKRWIEDYSWTFTPKRANSDMAASGEGVITPVRESSPYIFENPTNHRKTHFHRILIRYFQRQTFWRVYEELPWHMKMSGSWGALCSFLSSPSHKSQALTQVLPTVQNATGELYLEVGLTHEGFQCFQKAWSNLMEFSPGDIKDNQDVVRQKGR